MFSAPASSIIQPHIWMSWSCTINVCMHVYSNKQYMRILGVSHLAAIQCSPCVFQVFPMPLFRIKVKIFRVRSSVKSLTSFSVLQQCGGTHFNLRNEQHSYFFFYFLKTIHPLGGKNHRVSSVISLVFLCASLVPGNNTALFATHRHKDFILGIVAGIDVKKYWIILIFLLNTSKSVSPA